MAYKTILVHWGDAGAPQANAGVAAALARRFDAHLSLIAFGIEPNLAAYSYGAPGVAVLSAETEAAREQASELRQQAEDWLESTGLRGDVRAITCPLESLGQTIAAQAIVSDITVVAQPYGAVREDVTVRALEGVLFQGSSPVLVCPADWEKPVGKTVLVAWDRSLEATHAVRAGLAFMEAADKVDVVLVDPEPPENGADDPGSDLALMLSRHGIDVSVTQVPSYGRSTAEAIRQRAADIGADLMIMGAYGHSRLRESLIGGPTRDILEAAPVPVLMAH